MEAEHYDNVLIGSGEASKYLAWALAKAGERTAVIERALIGGSCPNIACLPSKNVIYSAKVASLLRRAGEFGLETGPMRVDMPQVYARKRKMVLDLIALHRERYRESGAELIMGEARLTAPRTVHVTLPSGGERHLRGARLFLNIGTRATIPHVPGLAAANPLTHVEALDLQRLPEHLVILGGGYVGLEFAQAFRRFGSEVTIVQRGAALLGHEDPDVSAALREMLEQEGIRILLETRLAAVEGRSGERLRLTLESGSGRSDLEATDILAAAGRTPNTATLGTSAAGVELDEAGYIRVNERLETTAPNTWAMGEGAGSPKFTHAAYDDYRLLLANLHGGERTTRGRLIPSCLFTDPELARVGLTEQEAIAQGIPYRVARLPMRGVLRTWTISEPKGFMKALVGNDDRILGFAALGVEASELLAAVQTAMLAGLPYQTLRDGIFTHPTMSEGIVFLFSHLAPAA